LIATQAISPWAKFRNLALTLANEARFEDNAGHKFETIACAWYAVGVLTDTDLLWWNMELPGADKHCPATPPADLGAPDGQPDGEWQCTVGETCSPDGCCKVTRCHDGGLVDCGCSISSNGGCGDLWQERLRRAPPR
jgi:hypothetical protein